MKRTGRPNYLYRVEETTYSAGVDEWGDPLPGGPTRPNLLMIPVLGETSHGWWIPEDRGWVPGASNRRWVSKNRTLPYACLTVEEAKEVFRKRCNYRIRLYMARAQALVQAVEYMDIVGFHSDPRQWVDPDKPDAIMTLGVI